jgi:hypothetical protein
VARRGVADFFLLLLIGIIVPPALGLGGRSDERESKQRGERAGGTKSHE